MVQSHREAEFALLCRAEGWPPPVREFRFAPPRRWRLDFAWPDRMLAVEIDGVTWRSGRHQRLPGYLSDCEKLEAAMLAGWRVYRVPGVWLEDRLDGVVTAMNLLLGV